MVSLLGHLLVVGILLYVAYRMGQQSIIRDVAGTIAELRRRHDEELTAHQADAVVFDWDAPADLSAWRRGREELLEHLDKEPVA